MTQDSEKNVFTFNWRIENFSMCPQKKGECITSPAFVVDELENTWWKLRLYPKGESSDGKYVSCYLWRASKKEEPEVITVGNSITIVNVDTKSSIRKHSSKGAAFKEDSSWGYRELASQEVLFKYNNMFLPNDILTIQCCIWRVTDGKESPAEPKEKLIGLTTPIGTVLSLEEISSITSDDSMTPEHYPTQCSACTRIPVERRQITWNVEDFKAKMLSKQRITLSVRSALRKKSALLLSCYASGDWNNDDSVRIDIQRKESDLKKMLVKCKVSLLDKSGVAQVCREDEHLFGGCYEVWSFPPFIKLSTIKYRKSALLDDDVLSMLYEFLISYKGEDINISGASLEISNSIEVDNLRKGMNNLLKDKELTDVTLISEDLEFVAHKTVLCSISPVFRAMFKGDTQEKRTGVVRITDIDAETVKNMRNFLYEDHLLDLQPEVAIKLYSAADKYQILSLKKKCASCLKYKLSLFNVCDVLVLADLHQDSDLSKYVENFLCVHAKDVFQSAEWKDLMKKNLQLAAETMQNALAKISQFS